jgi:hypothetical protein
MILLNLITSIADYQSKTNAELVAILNQKTIEKIDEQLYTWSGVALIAGAVGAESLRVALEQNNLGWVVHQLGGSGIQLSNPLVQQVLLGFDRAGVPGCELLASTGRRMISVAEQSGLGIVTESDVVAALLIQSKQAFFNVAASRWNTFVAAYESWDGNGEGPVL